MEDGFTLQYALEMASDDEPPESNILIDADSGDKDGSGLLDNLRGPQLLGGAEIRSATGDLNNIKTMVNPRWSISENTSVNN
ncbi:hypothetical protein JTB14_037642 [Gonioctena quinquepunctata]|nr:hypothetical protein JTB14_037642 [Gonioctena quinquepunctata]